jgi:hypothetical protein
MDQQRLTQLRETTMAKMNDAAETLHEGIAEIRQPDQDLNRVISLLVNADIAIASMAIAVLELVDSLGIFVLQLPDPDPQPLKATLRLIRGDVDPDT